MRIDAHQHFWVYNQHEYGWIDDRMAAIRRDFLPPHLAEEQRAVGFDGSVAVQARQTREETPWLLWLAAANPRIKGVVGWFDLQAPDIELQLSEIAGQPKLVGVRHVVQDEPDDNFMLRPEFLRGLAALRRFGLTYDFLIYPKHLPVARQVAERFPEQRFVLDHIAKPFIRTGAIEPWRSDIKALAACPNVYCKLSGMVTEADWDNWTPATFRPYLDVVCEAFGPDRLMIGSDWPVCTVAGRYSQVLGIVMDYIRQFPAAAQAQILGETAVAFYGLQV